MLQFRNRPRPRNYLAKREQVRLFALVTLLLGVVWIAVEARNPQRYSWLWNWGQVQDVESEPVNTRLKMSDSGAGDTFVVPRTGGMDHRLTQDVTEPLSETDLASIRDNEPFRAVEQTAWFKLWNQLRSLQTEALRERSIGPVTFIQLYRQPEVYRAELVTLAGTLRRAERVTAPRNALGIESYYRTWLFPRDNPSNPIVVYTLTVPEGFPQGMTIAEQVDLEGFFFKRWPYAAQDGVRLAPVVLAKSLRWHPVGPQESPPPMSPSSILFLAVSIAAVAAALVWWRTRRPRAGKPIPDVFGGVALDDSVHGQDAHLRLMTDPEKEGESKHE